MSAADSTQGAAPWETRLSAIDDEKEALLYAQGAVHEPLREAHNRAKKVLELEQARPNPRPTVVAEAQKSVDIMAQAMGMWRH